MLTQAEAAELAALEAEEAQARTSSGLTPEEQAELATLEAEEAQEAATQGALSRALDRPEADLGALTRAQYSIEPLETNRQALLQREFGAENVVQDAQGNLFVIQNGYYRPVNREGFSLSDVAEFAGALPETIPAAVGTVLGAGAAIPSGGVAAPATVAAGRFAGGVVGSALRQGISAAIGTPQVAPMTERLVNAGLSGAFSTAGGAAGDVVAPYVSKGWAAAKEFFKKSPTVAGLLDDSAKEAAEKAAQDATKQVSMPGAIQEITETAPVPGAGSILAPEEKVKLDLIAKRQNLPPATEAQAAGGTAILDEKNMQDSLLFGKNIREYSRKQVDAVKKNLESLVGSFLDEDSTREAVGGVSKTHVQAVFNAHKKLASQLYDDVAKEASGAKVGRYEAIKGILDETRQYRLFTGTGKAAPYTPNSGLTQEQFEKLQQAFVPIVSATKRAAGKGQAIDYNAVDQLRRTLQNYAQSEQDRRTKGIFKKAQGRFEKVIASAIEKKSPGTASKLRDAADNWAKYRDIEELFDDELLNTADENIVAKMLRDTESIDRFKKVIGTNGIREAGISHIRDILAPLSKSGVARADTALTAIRKNKPRIVEAIGPDSYRKLTDTLYYLNRMNEPLTVSRASLYTILRQKNFSLKEIAAREAGFAAQKAGQKVAPVVAKTIRAAETPTARAAERNAPASLANLLSEGTQKDWAYFYGQPKKKNDTIEKRKRALGDK